MTLDAAFDAWVRYLSSTGFAATRFLNPPASEEELTSAEAQLGFHLPQDLRQLWRRANGQQNVYAVTNPSPGTIVCPLFGAYEFLSVPGALGQYRVWLDIYNQYDRNTFNENFNGESSIRLRNGDPVFREYWRPGWLPFSIDGGGNSYAVDCSPAPGGTYGQVIVIGSDEDMRRVLAPSLSAFLADAVARQPFNLHPASGRPYTIFMMERRWR